MKSSPLMKLKHVSTRHDTYLVAGCLGNNISVLNDTSN